jgi:hypothetical protein
MMRGMVGLAHFQLDEDIFFSAGSVLDQSKRNERVE